MFFHGGTNSKKIDDFLDFSANTSPLGVHKAASKALLALSLDPNILACYPDPNCTELKEKLSEFWNFKGPVLCGSGAADIIQLISCVYATKGSRQSFNLIIEPAFSEYENGLLMVVDDEKILHLTLSEQNDFAWTDEDFEKLQKILQGGVPLLYMATPSNPAGNVVPYEMLEKIAEECEKYGTVFVIDACFSQFSAAAETAVRRLIAQYEKFPHVIVLNAFTKIYGMAGLRLGYALCFSAQVYDPLIQALRSWSISTDAQVTGCAVIDAEIKGTSWVDDMRKLIVREKKLLVAALKKTGARVVDGEANYVLFKLTEELQKKAQKFAEGNGKVKHNSGHNGPRKQSQFTQTEKDNPSATPLCRALDKYRIVIRGCSDFYGMDEFWYRASIKPHEENVQLIKALEEIFR